MKFLKTSLLFLLTFASGAYSNYTIQSHASFDMTEQQVKSEVGGKKGELLVDSSRFSLRLSASYEFSNSISVGLFSRGDFGTRRSGVFSEVNSEGKPIVTDSIGGVFSEFWIGPSVALHYRQAYLELGYGALGFRKDSARSDLPNSDGNTDGFFRTSPTVAWTMTGGISFEILQQIEASFRIEYRIRYYDRRAGSTLLNNVVHGTQDFTPFFGIIWRPTQKRPVEL